MSVSFSTLITAVYCEVDTFLRDDVQQHPRSGRGPARRMTESEVITLALIGQRRGNSERHVLAMIQTMDPTAFPHLLSQRQFNQRVRDLQPVMARLMVALSNRLDRETTPYELADAVSVPVVQPCREGTSPTLTPLVSGGYGGSSRRYFVGCHLLTAVTQQGAITGFVLGSARTEGHWFFDALVQWRVDPASDQWPPAAVRIDKPPRGPDKAIQGRTTAGRGARSQRYLVDNGFRGVWWHDHWRDLQAIVHLDGGKHAPPAVRKAHHRRRQRIEIVNGILKDVLHLAFPGAKTPAGILTRITAKCCMHNLGMVINQLLDRPLLKIGTLIRF